MTSPKHLLTDGESSGISIAFSMGTAGWSGGRTKREGAVWLLGQFGPKSQCVPAHCFVFPRAPSLTISFFTFPTKLEKEPQVERRTVVYRALRPMIVLDALVGSPAERFFVR